MSDELLTLLGQIAYELEPYPAPVMRVLSLRIASLLLDTTLAEAQAGLDAVTLRRMAALAAELTELTDSLASELDGALDLPVPKAAQSA